MKPLAWLDPYGLAFPPISEALSEPNGLLAAGGDLSLDRLVAAYSQGIFPWYEEGQPILWWSPDPRAVILPEQLKISRSLRKVLRREVFSVSVDKAFPTVIDACSGPRKAGKQVSNDTWITDEMKQAYINLHEHGVAHSVEVWHDQNLVGGLYGISLGQMFFGESMFSHATDASKVAFVYLVKNLARFGFPFIDCQVPNNHLNSLGASLMPRAQYLEAVHRYTASSGDLLETPWQSPWHVDV